jgi:ABC-2 type transport system permease protein
MLAIFFKDSLSLPGFDLSMLVFKPLPMIIGALLLIGGFFMFAAGCAAVGAATPTAKEASGFFSVVMIMMIIPIYVFMTIITSPESPIVQVLTYFPFTAPITAMIRNSVGNLPNWQAAVVIADILVFSALGLALAARIFKYVAIEYSKTVSLKTVLGRS